MVHLDSDKFINGSPFYELIDGISNYGIFQNMLAHQFYVCVIKTLTV